ncbi:restriction endonuclease subunit S [Antarcticibacterium flavum]|uniref:Restriction endonuclease subunit S n=1 Tax=Antarcticibacterium flavum TaxID=2058175 RepID=A0A5B7X1C1_9FLAO|nr:MULTISPECIES: restriction endonuclease subunit S [Antarcticibacterium]MCM4161692.1 restriction endonuclease subunit S [Antarcticibacterium sp. W02-3]QCY68403.1 restriction endonuclease subunit S [Antarcticibacterium flavum]
MPENWKTYKLEDLTTRVTVGFVGSMAQEYVENGIPMLRSQNIKPFCLDYGNLKYISPKFHEKIRKSSLKKDDVAIVRTGNPGTACVIPEGIPQLNCSDLVIATPNKSKIDPHFLSFYFNSIARNYISSELVGAVQQHFNVGSAKKMEIKLPKIEEQHKIVSILKAIQDKIELNLQMNKTLEEMAMALYKHWFVDFGPFQDGEFVATELGEIPKGWEVKSISAFGKIVCGKTPSKKDPDNFTQIGGYPFIKIPEMHGNVFLTETLEKVSEKGNQIQAKKLLPSGCINVSCIATVGLVTINAFPSHTNQQINSIIPEKTIYRYYLYLTMISLKERFLNEASGGSATLNMNTSTFSNIEILKPDEETLQKFSEMTTSIFSKILQNQEENQTLTQLRDTLLPKLISGEVRVKDVEKTLTEVL